MRRWAKPNRVVAWQLVLSIVVFLIALAMAAYIAVPFVGDALARRGTPAERFTSPDAHWQLSVYQVVPGWDRAPFWVMTVRSLRVNVPRERVIWRGPQSSFSWADNQVVLIRESSWQLGHQRPLDVAAAPTLFPWEGTGHFAAFFSFMPGIILLMGLPLAYVLPLLFFGLPVAGVDR